MAPGVHPVTAPWVDRLETGLLRKEAQMRGFLVLVLMSLVALGWFVGSDPGSLLLSGTALTLVGVVARRMRSARKERV